MLSTNGAAPQPRLDAAGPVRIVARMSATRIAILADIHANLPALEAVLEDIGRQTVDEVIVAGDLVGRGPQGSAVARRIEALGLPAIRGNHEDYLLDFRRGDVPAAWLRDPEWACARWMANELNRSALAYVEALPDDLRPATAPEVLVVHGSPRSNREGVYPWTPDSAIQSMLDGISAELVVCAHTHRPLERKVGARTVVNVGSVGLPFDGDRRACYAVLTRTAAGWRVEHRRVTYDRIEIESIYRSTGFLEAGGAVASALLREVRTAQPHLVAFLEWTEAVVRAPDLSAWSDFLDFYRPEWSLDELLRRARRDDRHDRRARALDPDAAR